MSERMWSTSDSSARISGEAKVADLEVPLVVEQEVERLEVAVNDARRVKEVHSLGGLQSEPHLERQRDLRDQLVVEEIRMRSADRIGSISLEWIGVLGAGGHEEDHVGMAESSHHFDLFTESTLSLLEERAFLTCRYHLHCHFRSLPSGLYHHPAPPTHWCQ